MELLWRTSFLGELPEALSSQVLQGATMRLDSQRFIALAQRNVELAWILARFLAAQVSASNEILAADVFLSVRARIARHLLDLAQRQPEGLVVAARHQHLADAI